MLFFVHKVFLVVVLCPFLVYAIGLSKACAWILAKQAASRVSGLKPVSLSNQGRNTLSFGLQSVPARRLRVSCAVCFLFQDRLNILWFSLVLSCSGEMCRKSNFIEMWFQCLDILHGFFFLLVFVGCLVVFDYGNML